MMAPVGLLGAQDVGLVDRRGLARVEILDLGRSVSLSAH